MKTVLVTGGAGFIGSNFVHHLYSKYPAYRILVLDLLTYAGSVDNLPIDFHNATSEGRIEFWYGDVRNAALAESLVKRSDMVVHFAAETHVTRSIFDNYHFFETDVLGTQTIANAVLHCADRIERFVHISTSEVYGTARSPLMSEEHALMPLSPYASAKAGADRLVYSYFATYNIPAVIVRPFNNYGPRQHLEKVVPRFITSCLLDEPLRVHGDGAAERDWTYVDDTCAALDCVLHCDLSKIRGEVINIGNGSSVSIAEIARRVVALMDKPQSLITYVGERPGQVFRHTADRSRAAALLGWTPKVDFDDGLRRTIEWYTSNRSWWQKQLWMRDIPIVTRAGKQELH
jgi:dTDP-glucose 4,6-dehydratase